MPRRKREDAITKDKIKEMDDLRKQGWTYTAIAKKIGCDHTTVMYYVSDGKYIINTIKNNKEKKKKHFDSLGRPTGRSYAQILRASGMKPTKWWPEEEEED